MDDGRRELAKYIAIFIVLMAVLFGGFQFLRATLGTKYPLMVVVSESMVPTLGVGDFILVGQIDDFDEVLAAPPPEGTILVYISPRSADEYIVHRAVERLVDVGGWQFITKGDNNPVSDSRPVPESRVIGRVVGRVPILGYFPLFIKTSGGLLLVASLMAIVFFADYLMPIKSGNAEDDADGRFPWVSLLFFLAAPVVYISFWFTDGYLFNIEFFALACWYVGCFMAPLAFRDDDLCLMFWLWDFVLLMIPLGCDMVWWVSGITPSRWWDVRGSTVPITWLLMKETPMFYEAFTEFMGLLLPGCVLFLLTMTAKRRGIRPLVAASRWIRSSKPSSE